MSKMDNLRAMREARYEAAAARAKKAGTGPKPAKASSDDAPATKRAPARKKAAPAAVDTDAEPTEELCGHRNMSGRTCTRERGHSAKSHRYS